MPAASGSVLKPCLFFGVLSSWGYCLNVWTSKGSAGRLGAAKYLVEGITISAISKLPQSPALLLVVSQAGQGRAGGCADNGCPSAGIQVVGNQRDQPTGVEGAEKQLDL